MHWCTRIAAILGACYVVQLIVWHASGVDAFGDIVGLWAKPIDWKLPPRLVSYSLAHDLGSPFHVVFNALGIYLFGRVVEEERGPRTVLFHFIVGVAVGGVAYSVLENFREGESHLLIGASAGAYALMVAAAVANPNLETIFRIPLWVIAAVYVAMDLVNFTTVLRLTGGSSRTAYVAHLGGAASGLFFALRGLSDVTLEVGWFARMRRGFSQWRIRRRERAALERSHRLDQILAKIHDHGMQSLTPEERDFLDKTSRGTFKDPC
jgi:rhomboid family protein